MPKRKRLKENIERGARLKAARIAAKYESAADAAADLDMDYSLYNNHELGWRGITRDRAKKYAAFFKVNLDWLYENIGPRTAETVQKPLDLLEGLPPEGQQEVLNFIEFTKTKYGV